MTEAASFLVHVRNRCGIRFFIQPKASKTRVVGIHDGMVKLSVAAPAIEGKANRAVVAFLADLFSVKKNDIEIVAGEQSRKKICVVGELKEDRIKEVLAPYLQDL